MKRNIEYLRGQDVASADIRAEIKRFRDRRLKGEQDQEQEQEREEEQDNVAIIFAIEIIHLHINTWYIIYLLVKSFFFTDYGNVKPPASNKSEKRSTIAF